MLSALEKLRQATYAVSSVTNVIGTTMLFGLVTVLNIDVVSRGVFHAPLKGSIELVVFAMVLIVFLQLPDVVRTNRLTRSDGFLLVTRKRNRRVADTISRIIDGLSCVFMAFIVYAVWPEVVETIESCAFFTQPEFGPAPTGYFFQDLSDAWARCEYFGTPGVFTAPKWPLHVATLIGVFLCAGVFLLKTILGNPEFMGTQNDEHTEDS